MSKFSKAIFRVFAGICVCFVLAITLFATGLAEPPIFLDIYQDKNYEEVANSKENQSSSNSSNSNDGSVTITTPESSSTNVNSVPSALNITLSGDYLTAFNKACKTLPNSDTSSKILIKVGLQILQSKTIIYENALHFYSLDYKNSGSKPKAQSYNLKDCINRINSKNYIYTDCFGFVRLTHAIACYTINSTYPEKVSGLSGLYGWKGGYSEGKTFNSLKTLKSGAIVYDTLTGSKANNYCRHVAMYLYSNGNEVLLMDQGGLRVGTFKNNCYIYSATSSNPYNFNKFKNYN